MIHETTDKFDFNKLTLCKPISNSSGSFFIKYSIDEKSLYIKPPKCYIKQIVNKQGRKYCDLVFQQENDGFIRWMDNLETRSHQLLFDHRQDWFKTDLEKDDIEHSFTSPMKFYKSTKQYIVRANFPAKLNSLKVYDEDSNVVPIESIQENSQVMVILEIQGVKSSTNFQVDIEVKQLMVLKSEELFDTFILKKQENPLAIIPSRQHELDQSTEPLRESEIEQPNESFKEPELQQLKEPFREPGIEQSNNDPNSLCEVDFDLDNIPMEGDSVVCLKERKEMYYQMYQEARQKARVARDLALSAYLEAKQIKNKYMLDDILDSSSDESEDEGSESETF
jgi:hypothetical protein